MKRIPIVVLIVVVSSISAAAQFQSGYQLIGQSGNLAQPHTIENSLFRFAIPEIDSHVGGLGGSWEGKVTQDSPRETYQMEMNLYGEVGNINYPSIGCGGNLEFIKSDGQAYWYKENITFGKDKCLDGGVIQMRRHALGDDTYWDWRWEGGGATARGVVRGSGVKESD